MALGGTSCRAVPALARGAPFTTQTIATNAINTGAKAVFDWFFSQNEPNQVPSVITTDSASSGPTMVTAAMFR